jgi:hypothetical protein
MEITHDDYCSRTKLVSSWGLDISGVLLELVEEVRSAEIDAGASLSA